MKKDKPKASRAPGDLLELRTKLSSEIDKMIDSLYEKMDQLSDADLELYQQLIKPDALPFESPLSPSRAQHHMRLHMAKIGFEWAIELPWGTVNTPRFADHVAESNGWAERFLPKLDILN